MSVSSNFLCSLSRDIREGYDSKIPRHYYFWLQKYSGSNSMSERRKTLVESSCRIYSFGSKTLVFGLKLRMETLDNFHRDPCDKLVNLGVHSHFTLLLLRVNCPNDTFVVGKLVWSLSP